MSKQLEHFFSHAFENDIWEISHTHNKLLITTRDTEALKVYFSLFDMDEKVFIWENLTFDESWWISVCHFFGEVVVFQIYDDTQNIEARSVFGFDTVQKQTLWSFDEVKLNKARDYTLQVTGLASDLEEGLIIDIRTGQQWNGEITEQSGAVKGLVPEVIYPIYYEADNPHFETLSKFLKSSVKLEIAGSCEYLESDKLFAVSANIAQSVGYKLDLFVFNHDGELLLSKKLDEEMKGLSAGTFFIVGQALIFVEKKRNLVLYSF